MTLSEKIDEMERLGVEFSFDAEGAIDIIAPLLPPGRARDWLNATAREFTKHPDAFIAEVEIRLWKREGVLR